MLRAVSDRLATLECYGAIFFTAAITVLIVLNVVTRALNHALFWVDEIAVYAMVWMVFLSITVLLKRRRAVAVTIIVDALPAPLSTMLQRLVDWIGLGFAVLLIWFCWSWYQPLDFMALGFDAKEFSRKTMNYIYQEKANTLDVKKFWIWLIMPYFACSTFVHSLANVLNQSEAESSQPKEL